MSMTTHPIGQDERDCAIYFTVVAAEPRTWEYPGAPAYVEFDRLEWVDTGEELTMEEQDAFEDELIEAAHVAVYGESIS